MQLCSLRVRLSGQPESWAAFAHALAAQGADILTMSALRRDGALEIDDLIIVLRRPIDLPHLAAALEQTGATVTALRPAQVDELGDPVVRALDVARALRAAPEPLAERLAKAASRLVEADAAWLACAAHPSVDSLVRTAITAGEPRRGSATVKSSCSRPSSWLLAVPLLLGVEVHALVVARVARPFTATETARLQALCRVATGDAVPRSATDLCGGSLARSPSRC